MIRYNNNNNNNNVYKKALSLNSPSLASPTLTRLATRQQQRRRRQQKQIPLTECNKKFLLSLGFKLTKKKCHI